MLTALNQFFPVNCPLQNKGLGFSSRFTRNCSFMFTKSLLYSFISTVMSLWLMLLSLFFSYNTVISFIISQEKLFILRCIIRISKDQRRSLLCNMVIDLPSTHMTLGNKSIRKSMLVQYSRIG